MTAPDPLGPLLDGLRVPPMPASLADRIAVEVARPDRVPTIAPARPARRRVRRWTRRGIWSTVVAVNLVVASAVAAAIGGGVIDPHRIVAAAHRIVEHIRHPHAAHTVPRHAGASMAHAPIAPLSRAPISAAPQPMIAPPVPAPPHRAIVAPALPPRAIFGVPHHEPPLRAARLHAQRADRTLRAAVRSDSPAHPLRGEHFRRDRAERRGDGERPPRAAADRAEAEAGPPPVRAERAAQAEPRNATTPPAAMGSWRQRGWRNWQRRQDMGDHPADDGIRAGERRGTGLDRADRPQRGVRAFPGGRRFGGGSIRRGGGGRRRF